VALHRAFEDAKSNVLDPLPVLLKSPKIPPPSSLIFAALLVGSGSIITFSPVTGSDFEQLNNIKKENIIINYFLFIQLIN